MVKLGVQIILEKIEQIWGNRYALEGADTNWNIYTTSYWESGSAEANDWFTFGPITIGSEGADLSWTHKILCRQFKKCI